jgi:hypothetical protein
MMDDLIRRFRDYQIEWLTAHNDIEFCEEEEKLIIGFLKDTAESFMRENQSEQQWIPPRRCIDCENFNKTQLLVQRVQQQWIPCSERLPDEGVNVLTQGVNGNMITNRIVDGKRGWWFWNDEFVAWMPLPEPYREETES